MKFYIFILGLTFFATYSYAKKAGEIIDVRRNITLAEDELPYKDFYIKLTDSSGLKKNLVVHATREVKVYDQSGKVFTSFKTNVGQLKIIYFDDKVAVAREFKLLSRDNLPMIEQIGIMMGDEVDLADSFVDNSKPSRKPNAESVTNSVPVIPLKTPDQPIQSEDVIIEGQTVKANEEARNI